MGKTNTKKLVQGAMLASLFGVLSLINTYTGSMFDILICYVMVIPLVWYGYTYTMKDNMIVSFVSLIVITMVGMPFFIVSSFSSCCAGVFIGEALKRKASKETILIGTLAITLLNNLLIYEVFSGILLMNITDEMKEVYISVQNIIPNINSIISEETVLSLGPLFLFIISVMEMYVIVLLCQVALYRFHIEFPGSFHIASIHLSKKVGLFLTIALMISYILKQTIMSDSIWVQYIYILTIVSFAIQGLAFLCFLCIVKRKIKLMILVMLGILIPVFNRLYVFIGFIDIFSDLREKLLYNNSKISKEG